MFDENDFYAHVQRFTAHFTGFSKADFIQSLPKVYADTVAFSQADDKEFRVGLPEDALAQYFVLVDKLSSAITAVQGLKGRRTDDIYANPLMVRFVVKMLAWEQLVLNFRTHHSR